MYQIPVKNLSKIRRPRKRVKRILCDIGMQQCQDLMETFGCFDAGDTSFNDTEWTDFIDGQNGKKKKKHPYRTQSLCCSLCFYSTRSVPTFRTHIHRYHCEELEQACLMMCPYCQFVGSPEVTEQHIKIFHFLPSKAQPLSFRNPSRTLAHASKTVSVTVSADAADDRYTCAICGYHDSLLYVMKKHVLVNHFATKLDRYFGLGTDGSNKADVGQKQKATCVKYHCKLCKLPAETIEHLLYHILSSEKHKDLHWQIIPSIVEKTNTNQTSSLQNLLVAKPNSAQRLSKDTNGNGAVLLAGSSNAALFCSPGTGQMFLSSSSSAVPALQNTPHASVMPHILPTSPVVKSINMLVPNMTQNAPKTMPITMAVPRLPQTQSQQVFLPSGVQVNLPGDLGVRPPILVAPSLLNQTRAPLLTPQSVRLIPTGNKVNGVPTYTLAPVQVAMPVQRPAQVVLAPNASQISQRSNSPAGVLPTSPKTLNKSSGPNELAALSPFLKKHDNRTVKCLRCKILLTEQGIFQHLLHGLKCLFCPQMFYSFKQMMEHERKDHSLKLKENREFIKQQFKLDCSDDGKLKFNTFNLNTDVPKDLLDNRELNLLLVTSFQDKIYIKMYPEKPDYSVAKTPPASCPFCEVKLQMAEEYDVHLQTKHHIIPTIHAILKTPAFKCKYCFGVYADKSTPRTISVHVQRCRCAPKSVKEAERRLNPDTTESNSAQTASSSETPEETDSGKPKSVKVSTKSRRRNPRVSNAQAPEAPVQLVLEPHGMEKTSFEDRKDFLSKYFHIKPYVTKTEIEMLASRLWINKADVKAHFNSKLTKCLKAIQKKKLCVRLGFKMKELNKLKHNLIIPNVVPVRRRRKRDIINLKKVVLIPEVCPTVDNNSDEGNQALPSETRAVAVADKKVFAPESPGESDDTAEVKTETRGRMIDDVLQLKPEEQTLVFNNVIEMKPKHLVP